MSKPNLPKPAPKTDAHGFDPRDFNWLPVPRARRVDGWSPHAQRRFIEALADSGSVTDASRSVGMSVNSCYRLRREPGAEGFASAWEAALAEASKTLVDVAFDRALRGVDEPVLDKYGQIIATRRRTSDRLLMFLLRAHHPERYATSLRRPKTPPPVPIMAKAIDALTPITPKNPQDYMEADAFEDLLFNLKLSPPEKTP
jgi:hypothetical protein